VETVDVLFDETTQVPAQSSSDPVLVTDTVPHPCHPEEYACAEQSGADSVEQHDVQAEPDAFDAFDSAGQSGADADVAGPVITEDELAEPLRVDTPDLTSAVPENVMQMGRAGNSQTQST
jgi:hypothetical protein